VGKLLLRRVSLRKKSAYLATVTAPPMFCIHLLGGGGGAKEFFFQKFGVFFFKNYMKKILWV